MAEVIILCLIVVAICAAIFLLYLKLEMIEKEITATRKKISSINKDGASVDIDNLAELAIANWRLGNNLKKMEDRLESKDKRRIENIKRRFESFLDLYDVKAEEYTGRLFNEGMNVEVLTAEDDDNAEKDYIKETERPAIYVGGDLYKRSCVIVARGTKKTNGDKKQEENRGEQKEKKEAESEIVGEMEKQ